jgi:hypothetical protein
MQLRIDLPPAELTKFHALGGATWLYMQVRAAEVPTTGLRGAYALTADERQQLLLDLPTLGRAATARKYRVTLITVDHLRKHAQKPRQQVARTAA